MADKAKYADALYLELQRCVGMLVEIGDLNGFRNMSDEELGRAWQAVARRAGMLLNRIDGLPSDYPDTAVAHPSPEPGEAP